VLFWRLLPAGEWMTGTNFTVILQEGTIFGVLALAALIPIASGLFDISFANVAGFASALMAWLGIHTALSDGWLFVMVIVASMAFGATSGAIISIFRLSSLFITLAMASVALAVTELILGGQTLYPDIAAPGLHEFGPNLRALGTGQWGPIPIAAAVLIILTVVLEVWLEHTPSGRRALATGSNQVAARLAGLKVARIQVFALIAGSAIAGLAGIILITQNGTADDVTASGYLLPAIAALFLGTTQFRFRRNVAGTVLAVFLLQTGSHGLELMGANVWVSYMFDGGILLLAVLLTRGGRLEPT